MNWYEDFVEPNFYFIVYPAGDRTKLTVVNLNFSTRHEKNDYSIASRKEFDDRSEAVKYCRELAQKNNLIFESDEPEDYILD